MDELTRMETWKSGTNFKASFNLIAEVFAAGVKEDWKELYFAFLLSKEGNTDAFLAVALTKRPKKLVDYSKNEKKTPEYFKAMGLMDDFWIASQQNGENWHTIMFKVTRKGEVDCFFSEEPVNDLDMVDKVPAEAWTSFLREAAALFDSVV